MVHNGPGVVRPDDTSRSLLHLKCLAFGVCRIAWDEDTLYQSSVSFARFVSLSNLVLREVVRFFYLSEQL